MYKSTVKPKGASVNVQVWNLLKEHGCNLLTFGALVEGWQIYMSRAGDGFCSYGLVGNVAIMLEGPIAGPERRGSITQEWALAMEHQGFTAAAVQVDLAVADVLHESGFFVNEMGIVTKILLSEFDFGLKGKQYTHIRRWYNTAKKQGIDIKDLDDCPDLYPVVQRALYSWKSRQGRGKEYQFLVRTVNPTPERYTRKFVALTSEKPVAVGFFDPLFHNNTIEGYYFTINRRSPAAPNGASDMLLLYAMNRFAQEGYKTVSLGLSPLYRMHNTRGIHSHSTSIIFRYLNRFGSIIYNFRGVAFHKSKYHGLETPTFCASRHAIPIRELLALLKLCGLFWSNSKRNCNAFWKFHSGRATILERESDGSVAIV